MTNEKTFKASNGVTITISDEGYLTATGGSGENSVLHATGGAEYGVQALREYFQHERDQELGRVRWPENPDYVIYWVPEHDDDEECRCVRVLHEPTAIRETVLERWVANPARISDLAAKWYFEEGPGKEPARPWEQAKPGEVWRLTMDGKEGNYLAEEPPSGTPYFHGGSSSLFADSERVTAGRKLLNADGSVADDQD